MTTSAKCHKLTILNFFRRCEWEVVYLLAPRNLAAAGLSVHQTSFLTNAYLIQIKFKIIEMTIIFLCRIYSMLRICFASVYHTNTKLDTSCNLWSYWATTMGTLQSQVMGVEVISYFP